jgi:hypothetical protein
MSESDFAEMFQSLGTDKILSAAVLSRLEIHGDDFTRLADKPLEVEVERRNVGAQADRIAADILAFANQAAPLEIVFDLPDKSQFHRTADGWLVPLTTMRDKVKPKPKNPPALLDGPNEITGGYYFLEELERARRLDMIVLHRPEITFWYRGLTLFTEGVDGLVEGKPRPNGVTDEAAEVQMDLIGLSVATAKSALDLLMAGTYSVAFAAIRHMIETFVLCVALDLRPDWSERLKEPQAGKTEQRTPDVTQIINDHIRNRVREAEFKPWDDLYQRWRAMHKGAHPSSRGLSQVMDAAPGKRRAGAVYKPALAATGFENGLLGLCLLLDFLGVLRTQTPEWQTECATLRLDVRSRFGLGDYPVLFTRT